MKCSNCDGLGWLFQEDRLSEDPTSAHACGDSVDWQWGEYALCPDCDGFGEQFDQDYAEDLAIMKIIEDYQNLRGFYRYYRVDFDERKVTMGIDFVWRTKRWRIIDGLPTFSKFARMWREDE